TPGALPGRTPGTDARTWTATKGDGVSNAEVVALEVRGVSKSFAGARVLDRVGFVLRRGEIHGLLGENGSGKSTLIKILAGYHAPDAGELSIDGAPVALPVEPGRFRSLGLSFVHQDLGLISSLSVVENLRLTDLDAIGGRW